MDSSTGEIRRRCGPGPRTMPDRGAIRHESRGATPSARAQAARAVSRSDDVADAVREHGVVAAPALCACGVAFWARDPRVARRYARAAREDVVVVAHDAGAVRGV